MHESATSRWRLQNVHKVLTGEGVAIAVLDTGIDTGHEAFKCKLNDIREMNFVNECYGEYKPEPHGSMAAFVAAGRGFTAKHKEEGKKIKPLQDPNETEIDHGVAPNVKSDICPNKLHGSMAAKKGFTAKREQKEEGIKPHSIDIASGVAPNAKLVIC